MDRIRDLYNALGLGNVTTPDGRINLEKFTGRTERNLPRATREPDEPFTYPSSYVAAIGGDVNCLPENGGVGHVDFMAACYGVRREQFLRKIAPSLAFLRHFGPIWVSNVRSIYWDGLQHQAEVRQKHLDSLGLNENAPTDVSGSFLLDPK